MGRFICLWGLGLGREFEEGEDRFQRARVHSKRLYSSMLIMFMSFDLRQGTFKILRAAFGAGWLCSVAPTSIDRLLHSQLCNQYLVLLIPIFVQLLAFPTSSPLRPSHYDPSSSILTAGVTAGRPHTLHLTPHNPHAAKHCQFRSVVFSSSYSLFHLSILQFRSFETSCAFFESALQVYRPHPVKL